MYERDNHVILVRLNEAGNGGFLHAASDRAACSLALDPAGPALHQGSILTFTTGSCKTSSYGASIAPPRGLLANLSGASAATTKRDVAVQDQF
jgi:hypothetical protein